MAGMNDAYEAAAIVRDAGGSIIGRTKLQKIGFFLEAAGVGSGFQFRYKHYGPYSEELASATARAGALRLLTENVGTASWGGQYSAYYSQLAPDNSILQARVRLANEMVSADAVELELAATAAYLAAHENYPDPWEETARRKPDKAEGGRLERAQELYRRLHSIQTPRPLPNI